MSFGSGKKYIDVVFDLIPLGQEFDIGISTGDDYFPAIQGLKQADRHAFDITAGRNRRINTRNSVSSKKRTFSAPLIKPL